VRTHTLVHEGRVAFAAIEMFLDLLRSAHGDKLLRMKGIVELREDPSRPLVVHGVQRLLHPRRACRHGRTGSAARDWC